MGNDLPEAAGAAATLGVDFLEQTLQGLVAGDGLAKSAGAWLAANKDRLVGLSTTTVQGFIASLRSGSAIDLADARLKLVEAMSFDEALEFHRLSTQALAEHANTSFRLGGFLDALAGVAQNVAPAAVSLLAKAVGL